MNETAIPQRPSKVRTAVYILYLILGLETIFSLLIWASADHNSLFVLLTLGMSLVAALLYYMIWKGKNWARTTFLLLLIIMLPWRISSWIQWRIDPTFSDLLDILGIAEAGLELVALALLYQRDSTEWFKP